MTLTDFLGRFSGSPVKRGLFHYVQCPAHDSTHKKLAVWEEGGWIKVRCWSGKCSDQDVIRALGLKNEDLKTDSKKHMAYTYCGADGSPLFRKNRRLLGGGRKMFTQEGRKGNEWVPSKAHLNGKADSLYRLPEVMTAVTAGRTIYVNEGEKACEAIRAEGGVGTCQPHGANPGTWKPAHSEVLRGATVVIVADRDEKGQAYAEEVYYSLQGIAAVVTVVKSKTESEKDDAFDHLAAGFTLDEFVPSPVGPKRAPLFMHEETLGQLNRKWATLDTVDPGETDWLWFPYIPFGLVSIIYGDGGIGKSTATLAIASALSIGAALPKGTARTPMRTILLSAEDPADKVIVPRLIALGADRKMFMVPMEQDSDGNPNPMILDDDGAYELGQAVKDFGASLVIIDPAMAYFDACRDMNRGTDVREWMRRLSDIARETGCAIVIIHHVNKNSFAKGAHRAMGSADFVNASRSAMMVVQDPDDDQNCAIAHTKHNLSSKGKAIGYTIEDGQFRWTGDSELTPESCSLPPDQKVSPKQKDACRDWIEKQLVDGPSPSKDIFDGGKECGFSSATIKRAKSEMPHVKARKVGEVWEWSLDTDDRRSYTYRDEK